jgi:hypothetical protein
MLFPRFSEEKRRPTYAQQKYEMAHRKGARL